MHMSLNMTCAEEECVLYDKYALRNFSADETLANKELCDFFKTLKMDFVREPQPVRPVSPFRVPQSAKDKHLLIMIGLGRSPPSPPTSCHVHVFRRSSTRPAAVQFPNTFARWSRH